MLVEFQTNDVGQIRRLIWRIEVLCWEGIHLIAAPLLF
jgi:hypothetical protein